MIRRRAVRVLLRLAACLDDADDPGQLDIVNGRAMFRCAHGIVEDFGPVEGAPRYADRRLEGRR